MNIIGIKDVIGFKEVVVVVVVLGGIVFGVMKYMDLPKKMEAVETVVDEHEVKISDVSHTFDLYMMEQRTIQREQNKREDLMLELIKEK